MELQELNYDNNFTKKQAVSKGLEIAADIFEKGNVTPLEALSNLVRMQEVINSAVAEIKSKLMSEIVDEKVRGVTFKHSNGGAILNYESDDLVQSLTKQLKNRKDALKLRHKSGEESYDKDGIEIPDVGVKSYRADSIKTTF